MIEIEPDGESDGRCACCGRLTRTIWGFARQDGDPVASYFLQWTVGASLDGHPANFDLIHGLWGDDATKDDRRAIALIHSTRDGKPGVTVIDAETRPVARSDLVGSAARREEIVGTSLATQAFAIFDAVMTQDDRCG